MADEDDWWATPYIDKAARNPGGRPKHPSMAYFPGTGPRDTWCMDCVDARMQGTSHVLCVRFCRMTGRRSDKVESYPARTASCRHYVKSEEAAKRDARLLAKSFQSSRSPYKPT